MQHSSEVVVYADVGPSSGEQSLHCGISAIEFQDSVIDTAPLNHDHAVIQHQQIVIK